MKKSILLHISLAFAWIIASFLPQNVKAQGFTEYLNPKVVVGADQAIADIPTEEMAIFYFIAPGTTIYEFTFNQELDIIMVELSTGNFVSASSHFKYECTAGEVYTFTIKNVSETTAITNIKLTIVEADDMSLGLPELMVGDNVVDIPISNALTIDPHFTFTPTVSGIYTFTFPSLLKASILAPSSHILQDVQDENHLFYWESGDTPAETAKALEAGHTYYLYTFTNDYPLVEETISIILKEGSALSSVITPVNPSKVFAIDGKALTPGNMQPQSLYVVGGKKIYNQ